MKDFDLESRYAEYLKDKELHPDWYEVGEQEYYFEDGVLHINGFKNVTHSSTHSSGIDTVSNMLNFEWAKDSDGNWLYPVVYHNS